MLDDQMLSFLTTTIRSTWALELLLLLRKNEARALSTNELVLELRATLPLVSACLEQLQVAELVAEQSGGLWRYAPKQLGLAELVTKLDGLYTTQPVAVIKAIVTSPNERLKSFADAFRFNQKGD